MHYLLFYEVGEDYVSQRAEFRGAHLDLAWKASALGELVLAGAMKNPVDGAVLLFRGESPEVAEKFARVDPYVTNGIVHRWYVREWTTVVNRPNRRCGRRRRWGNSRNRGRASESAPWPWRGAAHRREASRRP